MGKRGYRYRKQHDDIYPPFKKFVEFIEEQVEEQCCIVPHLSKINHENLPRASIKVMEVIQVIHRSLQSKL